MTAKKTTRKKTTRKAAAKKATRKKAGATRAKGTAKSKRAAPRKSAPAKAGKPAPRKRVSLLDAAATVLADAKEPMQAKAIVERVVERGLWKPGAGKTPHATLHAAMAREIAAKGENARFCKTGRGRFTAG
ncbi:MAG: hypothetical protein D6773_13115 [Alphaproteobacteria bacterium]|nr:MAG: hypothetical protein D6773_13115 [Alphaproteobacteria bacterium]